REIVLEHAVREPTVEEHVVCDVRRAPGLESCRVLQHPLMRVVDELLEARVRLCIAARDPHVGRERPPTPLLRQPDAPLRRERHAERGYRALAAEERILDAHLAETFGKARESRP